MKKSLELKEERSSMIVSLESIHTLAETEERELTTEESTKVDELIKSVDSIDSKIERAEKSEAILKRAASVAGVSVSTKEDKTLKRFSFQEAMTQATTGRLEGIVAEMDQEARSEAHYTGQTFKGVGIPSSILTRAQDYVDTANQNSVETMSFTDQLEANLVLASAGANLYGGINNMKFPVISGITSAWQPETGGTEADGTGATTNVTLSPQKLISIVNVSAESLKQNASLESALQRNMAQNIAATMESAFLAESDVTNAPTSLLADATSSSTAAMSATTILDLETDTLAAGVEINGARMAYILNMAGYAKVKELAQVSNVSAIWDNGDKRLNGYYGFATSNLGSDGTTAKQKALFGDFSKVHLATFGGLDLLYDPFTNGGIGIPRMIVTSLCDAAAVQAASFHSQIEA